MSKIIEIKPGTKLVCDTLRWDDGWEFDCPSMMISPVVRCFENGNHHSTIVENVLIDAVVSGKLIKDDKKDFEDWVWRGYKLPVLRRRFKEALAGKNFPKAGYHAEREVVEIVLDERGELTWRSERDTA